eukprot:GFUD01023108.1.p1 GENE.GFUD01023108.1~~GFUD01023108.1.p1  ORF type:complete len:100 (+),score=34.53 GFUD01023108.1:67-366(+)
MSRQPENKLAADKHGKEIVEQESGHNVKAVKFYIAELNNNKYEETYQISLSPEYGFANPFLPGGCLSDDADLMVKMWKEKRLSEMYGSSGTEDGDGRNI